MRLARLLPVVVVLSMSAGACGASHIPQHAATRFLDRYANSEGAVIRRDQGGDIVSEGQAYGMLVAELAGEPARVQTIWSWTSGHLGRPDGLFASRASGSGQIEDPHSATDADVLIAYALLRYRGPGAAKLNRAGRRVAGAVLENESVTLPDGAPLLVAGPWAKSSGSTATVDPSYLMPGIFDQIARLTGDDRWRAAARAAVTLIAELTDNGSRLPPDWAQFANGRLVPIAEPGGPAGVQYGLDAARLPIWFATSCDPDARRLAASWWDRVLSTGHRSLPLALNLDGSTINPDGSPLTLLAGAAAAGAAGDPRAAHELRAQAEAFAVRYPTYYGDAWAALGPALLDHVINA